MNKSNSADEFLRKSDYVKDEDVFFLSTLQKKLEYEQRLAEICLNEIEKSEDVLMNNTEDDAMKSSIRSSASDIQSEKIDITESCDQNDNQARRYQEASVRNAEMI